LMEIHPLWDDDMSPKLKSIELNRYLNSKRDYYQHTCFIRPIIETSWLVVRFKNVMLLIDARDRQTQPRAGSARLLLTREPRSCRESANLVDQIVAGLL
jgi:hypothetical protein